jgi:hypothetical protein
MEKQIYNEKNGLWYELQGDYYIPCLTVPKEDKPIGIWGQRRKRFLRENHKPLYMSMLVSGKLNSYLADLNEQAEEMYLRLVDQMAEREGITEQLKAEDQMEWVRRMNGIVAQAREIVNTEIIFA